MPLSDVIRRQLGEEKDPLPGNVSVNLPGAGQADKIEHIFARLGAPKALAYGRHVVGGNLIFQHEDAASGKTIIFLAHGLGEWEGPEAVFVNNKLIDHTNTNLYHFHPGLEGEAGVETNPAVRNQKICSFWPAAFAGQEKNFPRTAYSAFRLDPDPESPEAGFDIKIIMKCRRVRIFSAAGNQVDYRWTENPAWQYLDLLIETWIKKGKGAINEPLTADEIAWIDFNAFGNWASDCEILTPQNTQRCFAHPAFVEATDLLRASELLLLLGQAYAVLNFKKISPAMDKSRTSLATIGANKILLGSLNRGRKNTREAVNRFIMRCRQLRSGRGPGTISSSGTSVTGTGTDFTKRFLPGDPIELRSGAQQGEIREVAAIASDTALTLKTAFSANQTAVQYSNPALDFAEGERTVEDLNHQNQVRRVRTQKIDLQNLTLEAAERRGKYLRAVTHDTTLQQSFRLCHGSGALDWLPGDVITAPDDSDFQPGIQRQWQILEITIHSGLAEMEGLSFSVGLQEFNPSIFVDTADQETPLTPQAPPESLPPIAAPKTPPAAGSWISFAGTKGIFHGEIAPPAGLPPAFEAALLLEVQLASDSSFTLNVSTYSYGQGTRRFDIELSGVTRFARFRQRYPNSSFGPWVAFGAPTSVSSGHPADDIAAGGSLNPADPVLAGTIKIEGHISPLSTFAEGAERAFDNIFASGRYNPLNYLDSGIYQTSSAFITGLGGTLNTWVTVASFNVTLPLDATGFKASVSVTSEPIGENVIGRVRLRADIDGVVSNEIVMPDVDTPASGTATLSGLTTRIQNIQVQVFKDQGTVFGDVRGTMTRKIITLLHADHVP